MPVPCILIRGIMRIIGIIPARYASTRLPGKPLILLQGRPMIEHVWRAAQAARSLSRVIVATDDKRIFQAVRGFGGEAIMTPESCASGTDRLAKAIAKIPCDLVVNIQGDEPFIPPAYLDALVKPFFKTKGLQMSTLAAPLPKGEMSYPHAVKVVCDQAGNALYFSRSAIPYFRMPTPLQPLLHIGLYAYRRKFLLEFARWQPTPLEQTEALEQLRALEHGVRIRVVQVKAPTLSIDTPGDLKQANALIKNQKRRR